MYIIQISPNTYFSERNNDRKERIEHFSITEYTANAMKYTDYYEAKRVADKISKAKIISY